MTLLRDSPDDLFALVPLAASHAGVPNPAFVEKEYWALEALRSLQAPLDVDVTPLVIFKGGTSLSRALHLTRRFSDDVDVMLHYTGQFGKRARYREILKPLIARAASDLNSAATLTEATEGMKRNARLTYPTRFDSGAHSPGVLIEMTLRGADSLLPGTQLLPVQSYVGTYLDSFGENEFEDTQPFETLVLSPVRTLLEKVSLLHGKAVAWHSDGVHPTDVGRHYYDVHRLLTSSDVVEALSRLTQQEFSDICDAMDAATRDMRRTPPPRPAGGYALSPAFSLTDEFRTLVDDELATAGGLVYDAMPPVEECCARVRAHLAAFTIDA
jgi:hypothetical protein